MTNCKWKRSVTTSTFGTFAVGRTRRTIRSQQQLYQKKTPVLDMPYSTLLLSTLSHFKLHNGRSTLSLSFRPGGARAPGIALVKRTWHHAEPQIFHNTLCAAHRHKWILNTLKTAARHTGENPHGKIIFQHLIFWIPLTSQRKTSSYDVNAWCAIATDTSVVYTFVTLRM